MHSINQLILGDNLEILKTLEPDSIDLIYLDPPFFSNRNYEVIWGDAGEVRSFQDRWSGGIDHYIGWLKERVVEMHRVLKPTGSIFLHCDWHANAYIRVEILDRIFGMHNFKNEILWVRSNPKSLASKIFPNTTDSIFWYTKSDKFVFNKVFGEHDLSYVDKAYKYEDEKGRYRLLPLLNPNDDRPNLTYDFLGVNRVWRWTKDRMEKAMKKRKSGLDKNRVMALSFGALNIADYLTARRILNAGGEELNPVANFFIRKNCFGFVKIATTLGGMLSIYAEEKPKIVSKVLLGLYSVVVAHNIKEIVQHERELKAAETA